MDRRGLIVVMAVLACREVWSHAQARPIAATEKIMSLDGLWMLDRTKGVEGPCGNTIDETIRIGVSDQGVAFESRRLTGLINFDRSVTNVGGGNFSGAVSADLDAGWLAVTKRQNGGAGRTNVSRDVYIVYGDELTIWRTFNVELPDGSLSQNVCGNRQALVYRREPKR